MEKSVHRTLQVMMLRLLYNDHNFWACFYGSPRSASCPSVQWADTAEQVIENIQQDTSRQEREEIGRNACRFLIELTRHFVGGGGGGMWGWVGVGVELSSNHIVSLHVFCSFVPLLSTNETGEPAC